MRPFLPNPALLGRALALCLSVVGCQQVNHIKECKRFTGLANASVEKWQELHQRNDPTPQADIYDTLKVEMATTEKSLREIPIKDSQLKQAVLGYGAILGDSAKHSGSYAAALRELERAAAAGDEAAEKSATAKLSALRGEMKKVLRSHKSGMSRIHALCGPIH